MFPLCHVDCLPRPIDHTLQGCSKIGGHFCYHLEHNFGHGNDTLAGVLVVLNLLAFSLHSACELAETLWQSARRRLSTRRRLFEHLRTVTEYQVFPDWNALLSLLATGGTAAQPP